MLNVSGRRHASLATCLAVVVVPWLAVVAAMSAMGKSDPLPGLFGNVESPAWVDRTCLMASGLVAGLFLWTASRLGPHWEFPWQQRAALGFMVWGFGFLLLSQGLCPTIGRVVGHVSFEAGKVQAQVRRKGCRHAVEVVGPTVSSGTVVCLDGTPDDRLREGDSVALVRVVSDLGAQSGLALQQGDRR